MPTHPEVPLDLLEQRRLRADWIKFGALVFLFSFGFAVYNGVFQNFFNDVLKGTPVGLGNLEAFRELPGLLTAILAGTLVAVAEARIAAAGLLLAAIGLGCTGFTTSFSPLVAVSVLWSIGFHLSSTMQSSITLTLARGKDAGRYLGAMAAVGSVATIGGLAFGLAIANFMPALEYKYYFALTGILVFVSSVLCASLSHHASGGKRQPIVFRMEYKLYYLMTFLEGCRRQIFGVFAAYSLVRYFHVPKKEMLALMLVNAILITVTAPYMGKLIDRIGERKPLMLYGVVLTFVFVGFATAERLFPRDHMVVLFGLFIISNLLTTFGLGITTYLNRIVRPGELTPCLAMGTTMNHVAAVTVPPLGALLWQYTNNYTLPLWVGAGVALLSLWTTSRLPKHDAKKAEVHS